MLQSQLKLQALTAESGRDCDHAPGFGEKGVGTLEEDKCMVSTQKKSSFFPDWKPSDTIFKIAFWLGYLNSCINPIIYPCSSQEFKKAFQNVLKGQCLPRKYSANKYTPAFNIHHSGNHNAEAPKDIVCIPVSSGKNFYEISKSDSICEWKLFSAMQSMSTKGTGSKDKSSCSTAKVKSKGFLRVCCCANTSEDNHPKGQKVPTIKIHTISISDNGEDV
ncbi:hypothetical protein JD844_031180 [Phrynosoma platyrhinos]|uniref:Alpha-1A adrenergic receptor n=1 Tax=Phrynosoma platyrhinos TaxID=52577 RepID=A0ABQ7T0N6_PHRPL|nr:hypothetical protein JD844_031180 [Phrynosoma platyrhinos]